MCSPAGAPPTSAPYRAMGAMLVGVPTRPNKSDSGTPTPSSALVLGQELVLTNEKKRDASCGEMGLPEQSFS